MRRTSLLITAAALVVCIAALAAQAKPNFAGKWTMVAAPTAPGPGGGFGGLGQEFTAAQDDKALTITRSVQGTEIKSVYNLDGSDSKNTLNFQGTAFEQVSKVKWDGGKLGITTRADFNGNAFETSLSLSLDASGILTVESTRPDFQGGGGPITTKATYKKA
jgi:hypothetical protein